MEILVWLEQTAIATWVRESGTLWGYPLIITLHTVGLAMLVGGSVAIDLRLLGAARALPIAPLLRLFPLIWAGFVINATSGLLLFMSNATTKAVQGIFWGKLACIALGVITVQRLHTRLRGERDAWAAGGVPAPLVRLAATSLMMWAGAIAAGRLMAYL